MPETPVLIPTAANTPSGPFGILLPPERIAQKPVEPRDSSRLLVCRGNGPRLGEFSGGFTFEHRIFRDISELLTPNDLLVVNDTRVLPVRVLGNRLLDDGVERAIGGAVEAVFLRKLEATGRDWVVILRMSARVKPGMKLVFEPGLVLEILSTHEERMAAEGEVWVRVSGVTAERIGLEAWLERHGHVPLPPYIERARTDRSSTIDRADGTDDRRVYQTVYARDTGSAAAPTAGFHFTAELLEKLKNRGVGVSQITLNVGLGTFRPIKTADYREHKMHEESFVISPEFVEEYKAARAAGKRIIAVGTTVVRALESWARLDSKEAGIGLLSGRFSTDIFIKPPASGEEAFKFKIVDELITNFHLPDSTLIVLVAAAMGGSAGEVGVENVRAAYELAIQEKYRFFSYGDAMWIRGEASSAKA